MRLGVGVFVLLFVLVSFSYAYQMALVIAIVTLLTISVLLTKKNDNLTSVAQLQLSAQGECSWLCINNDIDGDTGDNNVEYFQLLATSRYSFLGCWLEFLPVSAMPLKNKYLNTPCLKKRQLFIYRDSVSPQSFSRLVQTIKNLD